MGKALQETVYSGVFNLLKIVGWCISRFTGAQGIYVFHSLDLGGAEIVHLDILNAVPEQKKIVVIASNPYGKRLKSAFQNCGPVLELNFLNRFPRQVICGIIAGLTRPATVRTYFGASTFLFYAGIPFVRKQVKILELFHAPVLGKWSYEKERLKYVNRISETLVITPFFERFLRNTDVLKSPISVVRNAVDPIYFSAFTPVENERLTIGFSGRNTPEKRLDLFLQLANSFPQYHFRLLTNELPSVEHSPANISMDLFTQDKTWLKSFYESLDVLCCLSEMEGLPMVVLEAMACKTVILTRAVGGLVDLIDSAPGVFEIPFENGEMKIDSVGETLQNLHKDRKTLNYLKAEAATYVTTLHTPELFKAEYRKRLIDPVL